MSDIIIQINLMIDALSKKKGHLEEVLRYTVEQSELLKAESLDLRSFNNIMKNKQVRIDKLIQIDLGFESLYGRIKATLTAQPDIYREAIKKMQQLIKDTTDLGVAVRVQEERNKVQFDVKSKNVKGEVKAFRTHKSAMSKYQNNYNKQQKADQPHFFDSKK